MQIQYDLFDERKVDPYELKLALRALEESGSSVRKGLFSRLHELSKLVLELQKKVEELEGKVKG